MPGFTIRGNELYGPLQNPPSRNEVRRTHRWVFTSLGIFRDPTALLYLKSASRPSLDFEEPSMHHNQEQIYFAGKHTWEPITLTWYDAEQPTDVSETLWQWINQVCDFDLMIVHSPLVYKANEAVLRMLDGMGNPSEEWSLFNVWPKSSNWNSLDYSSSDLQLIECKLRYDRAMKSRSGLFGDISGAINIAATIAGTLG